MRAEEGNRPCCINSSSENSQSVVFVRSLDVNAVSPLIAHTIPFRAMAGLMQRPKLMPTSNWGQEDLMHFFHNDANDLKVFSDISVD